MKRPRMNPRVAALGGCLAVAAACGCASQPTAEIDGTGYENGPQTQTVQCGTGATLDRNVMGGVGKLSVQVLDGANATVYPQQWDDSGRVEWHHRAHRREWDVDALGRTIQVHRGIPGHPRVPIVLNRFALTRRVTTRTRC
jgi:hypothetical protein